METDAKEVPIALDQLDTAATAGPQLECLEPLDILRVEEHVSDGNDLLVDFKATFDAKINPQDSVGVSLYKRVFPRKAKALDGISALKNMYRMVTTFLWIL
jgi:hypothetical protein